MEINQNLYKIVHLPNGNILLKLRKDVDETPYHLVLADVSFYVACQKNIGKINIYEPTNLTKQLLKIMIDETTNINSYDNFCEKVKWILENISTTEINKENVEHINKFKSNIISLSNDIKKKLENYCKNNKTKIKNSTWTYLFVKLIAELSGHNYSFGEEFFLMKLLNQYFAEMKWDYKQIYIFETNDDIDMCSEKGQRYYCLVQRLCQGDKKAFDGKEIEFFPSSFERNKMSISEEIFTCIQDDIYDDGINWKDYDQTDGNY